jgi:hypothetical protein
LVSKYLLSPKLMMSTSANPYFSGLQEAGGGGNFAA